MARNDQQIDRLRQLFDIYMNGKKRSHRR
jgi:hypothetical protein